MPERLRKLPKTVVVSSGIKSGVGKSTASVAMACAAATQADVGVSVALAYFNESGNVTVRGEGEVTQHDLVADALRMVPKRIVLGECREGEAFDMMQAMNTSHDGSPATGHINMHTRC